MKDLKNKPLWVQQLSDGDILEDAYGYQLEVIEISKYENRVALYNRETQCEDQRVLSTLAEYCQKV